MEFNLMRSVLYVDVIKEQYRPKMIHWLYRHHVSDSMSQFMPYVTKYAFYNALPTPPQGDLFGTNRMQLTEHYWLVNPLTPEFDVKAYTEYFPPEVLRWQGNIPDTDAPDNFDGDDARSAGDGSEKPFIWAFVPVSWEEELKGKGITAEDGPNYRWQFLISYPEGVSNETGDKWLFDEVLNKWKDMPQVRRLLTSKVIQEVNQCQFSRLVEIWFEGPDQWYEVAVENAKTISKPEWAQTDVFPYLKPFCNFTGIFLSDVVTSDNFSMYHGYQTLR